MRVPNEVHQAGDWIVERIAPDFRLLDVWALPVVGAREEFDAFVRVLGALDPTRSDSRLSRLLFAVRLRLGALLGWDDPDATHRIPGCEETSLAERLTPELRETARDFPMGDVGREVAGGFAPLYRTDDEAAAEIGNATVHGVLHVTWVPRADGRHQAHLAVYVKPRGRKGELYVRLIDPFRHLVVYPALLRHVGRVWAERADDGIG